MAEHILSLDVTAAQRTQLIAILDADRRRAIRENTQDSPWAQAVGKIYVAVGANRWPEGRRSVLRLALTGYEVLILTSLLDLTMQRQEREAPGHADTAVREISQQVTACLHASDGLESATPEGRQRP